MTSFELSTGRAIAYKKKALAINCCNRSDDTALRVIKRVAFSVTIFFFHQISCPNVNIALFSERIIECVIFSIALSSPIDSVIIY